MDRDRRKFLKDSLNVTAALTAAPLLAPSTAWSANDRPAYGVIGTGGRGRYVSSVFQKLGAQCVALCDVYQPYLELARKDAPQAKTYVDYNELLAQTGLDFVLIATPDHQHCPNLLAALAAGKDAYLEKPMSHSLEESQRMIRAVRSSNRIVQVGMQRRSAPVIHRVKALIDAGMLGRVSLAKPLWNWNVARPLNNSPLPGQLDWFRFQGPAERRTLEPMRFRSWRLFWDYSGGNMTDQGTHLMDVTQWFTNTTQPSSAICYGQVQKTTGAEAPDVFCAVFEYPKHMVTWTLNYCNSYQNGWSIEFEGDEGTLILDEEGFRIYKEPWARKENREPIYVAREGVPIEAHVQNFLDCIKSRQQPNCPVEVGASAVSGPHLANIAYHKDRRVKLNADGTVS
jgi:predicted dehydrogenase